MLLMYIVVLLNAFNVYSCIVKQMDFKIIFLVSNRADLGCDRLLILKAKLSPIIVSQFHWALWGNHGPFQVPLGDPHWFYPRVGSWGIVSDPLDFSQQAAGFLNKELDQLDARIGIYSDFGFWRAAIPSPNSYP